MGLSVFRGKKQKCHMNKHFCGFMVLIQFNDDEYDEYWNSTFEVWFTRFIYLVFSMLTYTYLLLSIFIFLCARSRNFHGLKNANKSLLVLNNSIL